MYSGTSKTGHYLKRTGSYSLRFRKTGDNSDLAGLVLDVSYTTDKAIDAAIMVQNLTNEIIIRKERVRALQIKIEPINKKLAQTLPKNLYEPLQKERANLNRSIQEMSGQIAALKKARKKLAAEGNIQIGSYHEIFTSIAKQVLPPDVFKDIQQATIDLINKVQAKDKPHD